MQTPQTPASSTPSKVVTPHQKHLAVELDELLSRLNMSASEFARMADLSDTILSPWRKGKYTGDVPAVESKISTAIKRLRTSGRLQKQIVETPLTKFVSAVAARLIRSGITGMIFGNHGIGKTCAAMTFSIAEPTAIFLQTTRWNNTVHGVERMMMDNFSIPAWQKSGKCRGDFIAEKLSGSRRLIIIDGADNLTINAKHWLLDLAALTGSPVLFICGPGIGAKAHPFLADARLLNAISMAVEITLSPSDNETTANAIFATWPAWLPTLSAIVTSHGIGRAAAVAALAKDMTDTGEPTITAIHKSATNCLCAPRQTPALR